MSYFSVGEDAPSTPAAKYDDSGYKSVSDVAHALNKLGYGVGKKLHKEKDWLPYLRQFAMNKFPNKFPNTKKGYDDVKKIVSLKPEYLRMSHPYIIQKLAELAPIKKEVITAPSGGEHVKPEEKLPPGSEYRPHYGPRAGQTGKVQADGNIKWSDGTTTSDTKGEKRVSRGDGSAAAEEKPPGGVKDEGFQIAGFGSPMLFLVGGLGLGAWYLFGKGKRKRR